MCFNIIPFFFKLSSEVTLELFMKSRSEQYLKQFYKTCTIHAYTFIFNKIINFFISHLCICCKNSCSYAKKEFDQILVSMIFFSTQRFGTFSVIYKCMARMHRLSTYTHTHVYVHIDIYLRAHMFV